MFPFYSPLRQGGKRSLFIVNTVVLARQQAEFLSQTTSFIVKCFTGDMNVDEWKKERWREEFEKSQVCILLSNKIKRQLI